MLRNLVLAVLLGGAATSISAATILDFEDLSSAQIRTTVVDRFGADVFTTDEFEFSSTDTVFAYGPLNSNEAIPNSGSVSLNVLGFSSSAGASRSAKLTMQKGNSDLFSVHSLRVAEGRTFVEFFPGQDFSDFGSTALNILGTFADGGSISYLHKFDGIADHDGPAKDFELVQLAGFENLLSLTLTGVGGPNDGYSFSIDDIVLREPAVVPLPSGAILTITALLGLGSIKRKRRSKN